MKSRRGQKRGCSCSFLSLFAATVTPLRAGSLASFQSAKLRDALSPAFARQETLSPESAARDKRLEALALDAAPATVNVKCKVHVPLL